jgi:hypothetical protein
MKTILACSMHICDYVAAGSFHGIPLLMLSLSVMPGLNSKVPFTCVCRTLYGPLVLLPNLQVFHLFLKYPLLREMVVLTTLFDFCLFDFHLLNVLIFVLISNQGNIEEHVPVEWETSRATSQGRMYCCSHGVHSNG